jgi:predicted lipid-binding transport protein (Tim44 family)
MSSGSYNTPTPQFGTAEYVGVPGNDHCQFCHQPVPQTYYRVNDVMACGACAEKMRGELAKDTHTAFMRALLYGAGAALLGMVLYATFEIVTGLIIGYVALAVGWLVGKAMMKGSGGVGGRRYQIAAAVLTYAAVSTAAIPIWIHYAGTQREVRQQKLAAEQRQLETEPGQPNPTQLARPAPDSRQHLSGAVLVGELAKLLLIGIASPFLELWGGGPNFQWVIGILILAIGIRIAWRMTAGRPLVIFGPFANTPQKAP